MKRLDSNAIPKLECDRCGTIMRPLWAIPHSDDMDHNEIVYNHFCMIKMTVPQLTSLYGVIRQEIKDGQV